jgi:hypothetical protein
LARENEEAQKNLDKMQSRAAYLAMDTSGANDLARLALNEELKQAQ